MNRIEEILKQQGVFMAKTEGNSMEPMLRAGRDTVIISPPSFPLKRYDVPVYRRNGHYTMHRVVWVWKKGYAICGDNRWRLEFDITDRDIVGVLSGFYREGSYVSCSDKGYLRYAKKKCRQLPLRVLKAIYRKICKQ